MRWCKMIDISDCDNIEINYITVQKAKSVVNIKLQMLLASFDYLRIWLPMVTEVTAEVKPS